MLPEERLDALLPLGEAPLDPSASGPYANDAVVAPLLATAARLTPLRLAQPSEAFAASLEQRLFGHPAGLSALTANTIPLGDAPTLAEARRPLRRAVRLPTDLMRPALVAAVLLLALFGSVFTVAMANPGSPLDGLRRFEEGVRTTLFLSAADRGRAALARADDALARLTAAAQQGDGAGYSRALADLRSAESSAVSEISNVTDPTVRAALAGQLSSLRMRERQELRAALPRLAWQQRLDSTAALAELGDAVPGITGVVLARQGGGSGGSGHTWVVTVSGTGFAPGAQVVVDGVPRATVTAVSGERLSATLTNFDPQHDTTSIGVSNPDGTAVATTQATEVKDDGTPGATGSATPSADDHGKPVEATPHAEGTPHGESTPRPTPQATKTPDRG